ncbi:MAG TPA: chemotaxis protein CheB, partial [Myxococcales bacterium]|nr:chemotaxis protein CheB [Myxococcales bacterium]
MEMTSAGDASTPQQGDPSPPGQPARTPVVGIGASAGGMESFSELLRHLPPGSGMAFVLIQHLDPSHPSYLREALARSTTIPMVEAEDRMRLQPDHIYVIPSNADVGLHDGALELSPRSPDEKKPHLPIDSFFKSLADDLGNQAIAVVLSGTGADGAEGLRAVKAQ